MKKALILLTLSFIGGGSLYAQQCGDSDRTSFIGRAKKIPA